MRVSLVIALVLFLAFVSVELTAQESRATIFGTITDQTGAVIPGVEVTVLNIRTNVGSTTTTNDSGYYEVPYLIPGRYRVEAALPGFKTHVREGIDLTTGQQATVNLQLEIGEANEVVNVTAQAPLLETSNASSGQVIDNRGINELPVTDMNPFALTHLAAGVVRNAEPMFNRAFDNSRVSNISISGAGNQSNEWTLDGMPNSTAGDRVSYVPPTEAVQEFKVMTSPFDASASGMGGVVNVSIKSGTNEFHGSLYELHRQQRWNATDWFVNRSFWSDVEAGRRSPDEERQRAGSYNQFGGTIGGPVILPGLYNGRERTFFFFSYNGIYDRNQEPSFYRMPTEMERQGNFSELLNRGGSDFQIYNPFSARTEGNRVVRDPFPGNIIPSDMISPIARRYLDFFPLPNNMEGAGTDLSNNYFAAQQPRGEDFYSLVNRFDHRISASHNIFVRWHHNNRLQDRGDWTGQGLMTNGLRRINSGAAFDDVLTINPRTILNFNIAWSMFKDGNERLTDGFDIGELGYPDYLRERAADLQHMPRIEISGLPALGNPRSQVNKQHIYSTKAMLSHAQGDHTFKAGGEIRIYERNRNAPGFPGGTFSFNNLYTRRDSATSAQQSGLALAAFLLGLPSGGSVDTNDSHALQNFWYGLHFQDDWRVTPRLTLNLGLRYEYESPTTERFNRFTVGFDQTSPSPIAAEAEAAYAMNPLPELPTDEFKVVGGAMFAGVGDGPTRMWNPDRNNFMPRIGLAYMAADNLVIRTGYGVFYDNSTGVQQTLGFQYGFSESTPLIASTDQGLTFIGTLEDPFPPIQENGLRFRKPPGSSAGLAQQLGQTYNFLSPNRPNPYQHRWRFGIQYEVRHDMVLEIAYTGSASRGLFVDRRMNFLPERFWATGNGRNDAIQADLTSSVPNPFEGLLPGTAFNGETIPKHVLLRPFPQFSTVTLVDEPVGKSSFHSGEVRIEKRFSTGWSLLTSYTRLKQLDETTRLNEFDSDLDRHLSPFSRDHRFVASGIWELPFGRDRRFGTEMSGWLNAVLGGWQLGWIYQAQSDEPLTFGNLFYQGSTQNLVLSDSEQTIDRWFNTDGFVRASAQQPGSFHVRVFPVVPNEDLRQDSLNLWDLNLLKKFDLAEEAYAQFRLDLLNALNHPHFAQPNRNPTSGSFGRVTSMWGLPRMIQLSLRIVF
ncbi:MAG TPA: TonB-dependent receptor [Acidobacteriota bacterium]|nr:TonB-dependent receptor [Acidobacteriota bacterium]